MPSPLYDVINAAGDPNDPFDMDLWLNNLRKQKWFAPTKMKNNLSKNILKMMYWCAAFDFFIVKVNFSADAV